MNTLGIVLIYECIMTVNFLHVYISRCGLFAIVIDSLPHSTSVLGKNVSIGYKSQTDKKSQSNTYNV